MTRRTLLGDYADGLDARAETYLQLADQIHQNPEHQHVPEVWTAATVALLRAMGERNKAAEVRRQARHFALRASQRRGLR